MRRAVAVVWALPLCLGLLSGCVTEKSTPSMAKIEDRLNHGDARGDQGPYWVGMELWFPFGQLSDNDEDVQENFTARLYVDLENRERRFEIQETVFHYKGDLYSRTFRGNATLFRDYSQRAYAGPGFPHTTSLETGPFFVEEQDGFSFSGRYGETSDLDRFVLLVDGAGRFERLRIGEEPGRYDLTFHYDSFTFPPFDSDAPRRPYGISPSGGSGLEPETRLRVDIGPSEIQDAVRPTELEFRFLDEGQNVLEAVGFESRTDHDGYFFDWTDGNGNNLVDLEDTFEFQYPEGTSVRIFDEWANAYTDHEFGDATPSAGWIAILAAFAAAALLGRRPPP